MTSAISSTISSVIPGYTPTQNVSFMILSVFSSVPIIRYPSPADLISSKHGCFIRFPANNILVCTPCFSIYCTTLFLSVPSLQVTRKPNQLGREFSHASGSISLSSRPLSPAIRRVKLWRLFSTKAGNFSSWAQPMAACMSVAFRL